MYIIIYRDLFIHLFIDLYTEYEYDMNTWDIFNGLVWLEQLIPRKRKAPFFEWANRWFRIFLKKNNGI